MKFKFETHGWLLALFLFIAACGKTSVSANDTKPNIIIIYADDLGKGLLSHEGQNIISTPNIDQLAHEGIRFTNAYSNMVCAPARASLLTGLHDCHQEGFEITKAGIYKKISTNELSFEQIEKAISNTTTTKEETTMYLATIAQKMGYKTCQIGKLDWGFATNHQQVTAHGWDYYFGYFDHQRAHGFYPPFLFENGKIKYIEGNSRADCGKTMEPETEASFNDRWNMDGKKQYSQSLFMNAIENFITSNKNHPFLLYFPTQLPHGPVAIPEIHNDFVNNDQLTQIEKEYASMVKLLDEDMGRIMDILKENQLEENTIVIFTSDNGHEIYYAKEGRIEKPYSNIKTGERFDDYQQKYYSDLSGDVFDGNNGRAGLKRSNLQGGIEVPLILKWPRQISSGSSSELLVANYDLTATIADIIGFKDDFNTDGISFAPTLMNRSQKTKHEFVVYSSFIGPTLITHDGWKIRNYIKGETSAFELYFLPEDYKEERNLVTKHPEKLEQLKFLLIKACDGDLRNGLYQNSNQINIELP